MCLVLFLGTKLKLQRTDLELEVYRGLFNFFFFVGLLNMENVKSIFLVHVKTGAFWEHGSHKRLVPDMQEVSMY